MGNTFTGFSPCCPVFATFPTPFLQIVTEEECKLLFKIASRGRAADIHVAIGSVDEKLPAGLEMCCQEKITAPIGANTLLSWYCPFYSVTAFQ